MAFAKSWFHHHHRSLRQRDGLGTLGHHVVRPTPLWRAAAMATMQLFHPALPLSLSTVLLHVVFGLPLALLWLRSSGLV